MALEVKKIHALGQRHLQGKCLISGIELQRLLQDYAAGLVTNDTLKSACCGQVKGNMHGCSG